MFTFIAIPLVLNFLAVLACRGVYRYVSMLLSPLFLIVFVMEYASASQQGNLTGLLTMLISGPLLVVLLLLVIGNLFTKKSVAKIDEADPVLAGANSETVDRRTRSAAWRVTRWELAGALLSLSVAEILALIGGIFRPNFLSIVTDLMIDSSARYAVWLIAVVLGVIGGASLAWLTAPRNRP